MTVSAKVVLDSISPNGVRLTTMELRYPRFIHSEFMTHRTFSRNASSSRAVSVEKLIEEVINEPAMPERWGLHAKGMQDGGTMTPFGEKTVKSDWLLARDRAVDTVKRMLERPERASKQIINRILEPFSHITVVVSSTFWENFDQLRRHEAADPTMQVLAQEIVKARSASLPLIRDYSDWHLPYIDYDSDIQAAVDYALVASSADTIENFDEFVKQTVIRMSVARCARVSYLTHDNRRPSVEEDLTLFHLLMSEKPLHASPAEHQAQPDHIRALNGGARMWDRPDLHGNFVGWKQYRKGFIGEAVMEHDDILYPERKKEAVNG